MFRSPVASAHLSRVSRQSTSVHTPIKDLVYLFQFPVSPYIRTISPFSLKLETWLRRNKIDYENVHTMKKHPKIRQIPYIELNGEAIPDSSRIIQRLTKEFQVTCDSSLTKEQKAIAHATTVMLEYRTMQIGFYWRYGHHAHEFTEKLMQNYAEKKFGMYFFRNLHPPISKMRGYMNGFARHSFEDMADMTFHDLDTISELLAENKYFLGTDRPTTIDCTIFGHLVQFLYIPLPVPQKAYLHEKCQNVVELVDRVKMNVWPDWEEMCETNCMKGKMGSDFRSL